MEALLRRARGDERRIDRGIHRFGDVEVEMATRTVRRNGHTVSLTPMEFDLLVALLQRKGAVASRLDLLTQVWGHASDVHTRTIDTHIGELRRKLEKDPSTPQFILPVRKAGYRLATGK